MNLIHVANTIEQFLYSFILLVEQCAKNNNLDAVFSEVPFLERTEVYIWE